MFASSCPGNRTLVHDCFSNELSYLMEDSLAIIAFRLETGLIDLSRRDECLHD